MTEIILLIIILFQFAYSIYQDISFERERERLLLKIMSKNVEEYTVAVKEVEEPVLPKNANEEEEMTEYADVSEVPVEKLMKAEDNL